MKIKSAILILFFTVLCSASVFATWGASCSETNLKQKYHCLRFIKMNWLGTIYHIDLEEVSGIFDDKHGHVAAYLRTAVTTYQANCLWVLFKNGQWLDLGCHVSKAPFVPFYEAYQEFIYANPEFRIVR